MLHKFHIHVYKVSGMMEMDLYAGSEEQAHAIAFNYFEDYSRPFNRFDYNLLTQSFPPSTPIKFWRGTQPIIHRTKFCRPLFPTDDLKQKFKKPSNLSIVTCHNYSEKSIFEESLEFLGIEGCENVCEQFDGPWRHAYNLKFVLNYLKAGRCRTPYLLYGDARDCILRDDPQTVLDIFLSKDYDLLFCATMHRGGYACMPEIYKWTRRIQKGRYLNTGGYIGRADFIQPIFEDADQYITPNSLSVDDIPRLGIGDIEKYARHSDTRLCKELPEFPKNADDQNILRFLHPKYYPRMAIDYHNEIFFRN